MSTATEIITVQQDPPGPTPISRIRKHPILIACLAFLVGLGVWEPLGLPLPHDPAFADSSSTMLSPSVHHWFGTDQFGYDIFSRAILAANNDLSIAASGVMFAAVIGTALGVAWSRKGTLSEIAMRIVDLFQSLPMLAIAITLVGLTGGGPTVLFVVIIGVITPIFIRLVRAECLLLRRRGYILVANSYGASELRLSWRHLIPNSSTVVFPQLSLAIGQAVIMISGLGFLGLQPPGTPSWGGMLQSGISFLFTGQWWITFFPSIMIFAVVLAASEASVAVQKIVERPSAQAGQW